MPIGKKFYMNKYQISFNSKRYTYLGANCDEAMNKLTRRMVFGNPLICNVHLKMYDADTQGESWAKYDCDGKIAIVDRIAHAGGQVQK